MIEKRLKAAMEKDGATEITASMWILFLAVRSRDLPFEGLQEESKKAVMDYIEIMEKS